MKIHPVVSSEDARERLVTPGIVATWDRDEHHCGLIVLVGWWKWGIGLAFTWPVKEGEVQGG